MSSNSTDNNRPPTMKVPLGIPTAPQRAMFKAGSATTLQTTVHNMHHYSSSAIQRRRSTSLSHADREESLRALKLNGHRYLSTQDGKRVDEQLTIDMQRLSSDTKRKLAATSNNTPQETEATAADIRKPLNLYRVPDGIMQVFVMSLRPSKPVQRPYVVIRLGDQVFQTSVSRDSISHSWNEGFELIISYHMQLFGTVHLDVYSNNMLLPDTHVGRAEIRLSMLDGFPEVFTSYYEIWHKRSVASTVPQQRQRKELSKNLGALQVRVNYRFQKPNDPEPQATRVRGAHIAGTVPSQMPMMKGNKRVARTDLPIEDLVAEFANEHNRCMEMARSSRNVSSQTDQSDAVGFAKVDEDDGDDKSAVGAVGGGGGIGWFGANASKKDSEENTAAERTVMESFTNMFISPSTFMAIKSIDRLVASFNQGVELSNTELLGGLLTLYRLYTEADIPEVSHPLKGDLIESIQELELPGRYARYALATYGWRALYFFNRGITLMDGAKGDSDVTSVLQYLGMSSEDLLGYEFRSSQLFCPSYFVAHDRAHSSVVLAVRGTMSAEDTVVDLSCEYTKWNGGLVHSGMKASAHWLFVEVMPQILAYARTHNLKTIRIVGHSLGASTAAILMIMIQSATQRLQGLGVDCEDFDIRSYCYGPAPCVSKDIADRFRDRIDTFVYMDDLVPRLCYGSVYDFKRMSINAADESDNLAQRLYAPFEDAGQQKQRWEERFKRLLQVRKDILAAQDNLHLALPGNVHHIVAYRRKDRGKLATRDEVVREIARGRRELFGGSVDNEAAAAAVSTPVTKVQSNSVEPEELADALNTAINEDVNTSTSNDEPVNEEGRFAPAWIQRVDNGSFQEIVLRPTIITDHMPSAYEQVFAHVIQTLIYCQRSKKKT